MKKFLVVIVAALVTLGTVGCGTDGPKTKQAKEEAKGRADARKAVEIRTSIGPNRIRCDASTRNIEFFDPTSGDERRANPIVFYYEEEDTQRILCYDGPGYDSLTGGKLKEVTKDVVYRILNQAPPPRLVPPPVVVSPQTLPAAPVITATPLPELGQGPCCGRQR